MDIFYSYKWNINNKVNEKNAYLDFITRPRLFLQALLILKNKKK